MPVECIDWQRFAYGQTSDNSSSLSKPPHSRSPEDAQREGEAASAESATPAAVRDAKEVGSSSAPAAKDSAPSDPAPSSAAEAPRSDGRPAAADAADDAAEPATPPSRVASLHDRGGGRSGWLSFGSSSGGKHSGASRSRPSHASSGSKSSSSKSSSKSGSSASKRSSSSVASAQEPGETLSKKRKLLKGGVAACGATSSDGESSAAAQQLSAAAGEGRLSKGGRSVCRNTKNSSSSTSEGEPSDSDEESLDALQLCLQESEAMTDLLVEELGGPTEEGKTQVRQQIGEGRCHCRTSLGIPKALQQHCEEVWERLKDYQKCGVHWLVSMHKANRNGILADEMGLGKTAQTCVFFNYAYSSGLLSTPTLIAAPASLVDNWVRELETWAPHLAGRVVKYAGKQSERRNIALECIDSLQGSTPFRVLVASVNSLSNKWDVQYLRQLRPFAYLVVDEAHALKNKDSQVYKNINKMARCERRILLTGSPIQNRTGELRNLLLFLMPAVFDSESLDLALTAFERQAQRQRACEAKAKLKANKAQQAGDKQKGRQEQLQPEQQHKTEPPSAAAEAEGNSGSNSSNCSSGAGSGQEQQKQLGETTDTPEEENNDNANDRSFLSRAFATLASRGAKRSEVGRLPADVTCLQRVLSPFILRRLKSEVMQELPRKTNIVLRCELEGSQKTLYLREVRQHESDLALSLRRLTQSFALDGDTDQITSSARSGTGTAAQKGDTGSSGQQANEGDSREPEAGGKRFVSSLLFRLRRICNHSLLMQGRYTSEQKDRMARHYAYHVDGFKGNPIEKIRAEFDKWSDYEIHQGVRLLAEQGDMKLADLALPAEAFLESTKLRKALELLKEVQNKGEKALVFSQFTTFLDVVEEALQLHLPTLRFCRLDGSTVVEERQRLVDGFNQTEECTAFLLSTKAGGQGLNLTAARTVILLDQDWNPQNDRQAEDRVHRLGQTHEVTVYRLCCRGTVEESILKCCQRKLDLDSAFGGNSEVLQAAILRLNSCASSTPQALLEFREWRKVVNSQKAPLSLLCSWTRQSSDSGDDEDFEDFHLLCDEFIDNGRAVKGGSRLAAELDSWLLAQPHGEDVSWRGSPKLQRQWSDPSSEAELKTNLAMAVSGSQRTERSQLYWMKR
ncbi:SNF2 family helicase, putative [Eimeria tenella]|uniref:SNF2 family helicase, putative n=1 Tax=Eimeria tenella TaxID=5802 RepID=U6KZV8_EIMTE|nr:SNF2 family helicase, putative [Eimeria tenella]CDJ43476.1 SNF2 family helicase, putative [Eimeria tenella]|eukprot:XP_013234226.1 SNF2 family helicase, putative [Eimeria tenella]